LHVGLTDEDKHLDRLFLIGAGERRQKHAG